MATMNRQTGFADRWQDVVELIWNRTKMTHSDQPMARFAGFPALRWLPVLAILGTRQRQRDGKGRSL
jgi:hypothetical protein